MADKAASFVTDIAAAAGDMEGGLDEGLASNLMGSALHARACALGGGVAKGMIGNVPNLAA